jgi:hypothetical protein
LVRELGELARPLGEERVAAQAQRRGSVRELGPAPAVGAVLRRGVDEKDGVANGEAPLAVPSSGRSGFARVAV